MIVADILNNKEFKSKQKVALISTELLTNKLSIDELILFCSSAKDAMKGTCIEAIEFATNQQATMANENCLQFVTKCLTEKAPRIKWESAKVIGNIAHLFPKKLDASISNLLANTEHSGTVVRWASAFALSNIIKLNTTHNKTLLPAIENLLQLEQNNGVKNKYKEALKKSK